jgi:hypothetical protein
LNHFKYLISQSLVSTKHVLKCLERLKRHFEAPFSNALATRL